MPLAKRIIPCLDVDNGRVVKGTRFVELKDAGDPIELAKFYDEQGADEIVFLDITASSDKRKILIDFVEKTGEHLFIPFTVGGGIRTMNDVKEILRTGADKISINTAAVRSPEIITNGAKIYGSQCIVVAIDAKRVYVKSISQSNDKNVVELKNGKLCWWEVYINGGRTPTGLDAIFWAKKIDSLGGGEILLTSMDFDGTKDGYDLELTRNISERVNIPIIASGGAGYPQHFVEVFNEGKADAALAASIFHYREYSIHQVKSTCIRHGITMRS